MSTSRLLIGTIILLGVSASAFADDLFTWQGVNGASWTYYYVSPYYATDTNRNLDVKLYCIDFNHDIAPPNDWYANIRPLTLSNTPAFLHGHTTYTPDNVVLFDPGLPQDAYVRYREAAWLMEDASLNTSHQIVDQVAAWQLFEETPNGSEVPHYNNLTLSQLIGSGTPLRLAVDTALETAKNAVQPGNGAWSPTMQWSVVTGVDSQNGAVVQEFLTSTPVPEPSAVMLFVTVLVILRLGWRRRQHQRQV